MKDLEALNEKANERNVGASAPSFASSSLSSYSTPSSSVDPAVMRQKAFETIQRVTPMIEKMIEKQGSDNSNSVDRT